LKAPRIDVDANNISWQQIINFYIDWKNDFLSKLQSFLDQIRHKDIAKMHNNFLILLKLKSLNLLNSTILTVILENEETNDNTIDIRPLKLSIRQQNSQERLYNNIFVSSLFEGNKNHVIQLFDNKTISEANRLQNILLERNTEELVAQLKTPIDYNGLIHQFKNYLLRNDEKYRIAFFTLHSDVEQLISKLRTLKQYNRKALYQLDSFSAVLNQYEQTLSVISQYRQQEKSASEIDQLVIINDDPVNEALEYLQSHLWEDDPLYTLDVLKNKNLILQNIENHLSAQIQKTLTHLLVEKRNYSYIFAVTALLLSLFVIALLLVFSQNINDSY
jgi:hypothetical protein